MDAMEVGRLMLELIGSAKFDEATCLVQTVTGATYEEATCRVFRLTHICDYGIEIPIEAVYELLVTNEYWLIARAIEGIMMMFGETTDILQNLGYIACEPDERPAEKSAERQNPITGLLPAECAIPAHKRLKRWHTAATGE